jgi:hypothetical protein
MNKPTLLSINNHGIVGKNPPGKPQDNDPRKGGLSLLLDFTRAEHNEIVQRDTYRRVYANNDTYTMPRNPKNRLRVRGEEYFVRMEITGSAKQKDGKKKFPMFDFFKNTLLPKLDAKAEELSQKLNKIIVIRYQHNNTAPHKEKNFKLFLEQQFAQWGG